MTNSWTFAFYYETISGEGFTFDNETGSGVIFASIDDFVKYVKQSLIDQKQNESSDLTFPEFYDQTFPEFSNLTFPEFYDQNIDIPENNIISTNFKGAHGRFPTIYSYGMSNNDNGINPQYQGPHTLSHVSVDFLMDHAAAGYDFTKQIIHPNHVIAILQDFGVIGEHNTMSERAFRYITDYTNKYCELVHLSQNMHLFFQKPNALVRELMEMHPMAVYSWLTNVKQTDTTRPKPASSKSRSGKGERYGNTITLDSGWVSLLGSNNLSGEMTQKRLQHMKDYLGLRLSMLFPEKSPATASTLDRLSNELMKNGKITI